MSAAPFTPEQEARLREIVRAEARGVIEPLIEAAAEEIRRRRSRDRMAVRAGNEGSEAIPPPARDGEHLIVHTPLGGGRPRKFKGVFDPKPPFAPQGNA